MLRRLLASSRNRFILGCCLIAPVFGGCAGIEMSCSGGSRTNGTVVASGAPASADRGSTVRINLKGTQLTGPEEQRCIEYIVTSWDGAENGVASYDVPSSIACEVLGDFFIDVKVPTHARPETGQPLRPYVGDELTIQANSQRKRSLPPEGTAGGVTFAGPRSIATTTVTIAVPPSTPANAAPTADVFSRYDPMPSRDYEPVVPPNDDPIGADAIARSFAAVDARMSSDPEGGALTYAWDLDGDGAYGGAGDAPAGGTTNTDLPPGVAIVPADRRQAPGTSRSEIEVGVQVTDPAGLVGRKRITITVQNQGYYPVSRKIIGLDTSTPTVGGQVGVQFDASGTEMVCIVGSGANPLSSAGTPFDINTTNTAPGKTFPIAVTAAGPHRVTVALLIGQTQLPDCANVGSAAVRYVWSDVYTAAAARKATKPYTARARLTVRGMVPLAADVTARGTYANVVARGRYQLRTPAKGGGVKRPAALGRFRNGDVVVSAPALDSLGAGANETAIGTSTMLLRGTSGTLACVATTATPDGTTYSFVGGTGAARRLTAEATATPARFRGSATMPKRSAKQKRPARGNATIVASTGAARGLPSACRALVKRLP